jgi:hypothetical protein
VSSEKDENGKDVIVTGDYRGRDCDLKCHLLRSPKSIANTYHEHADHAQLRAAPIFDNADLGEQEFYRDRRDVLIFQLPPTDLIKGGLLSCRNK